MKCLPNRKRNNEWQDYGQTCGSIGNWFYFNRLKPFIIQFNYFGHSKFGRIEPNKMHLCDLLIYYIHSVILLLT